MRRVMKWLGRPKGSDRIEPSERILNDPVISCLLSHTLQPSLSSLEAKSIECLETGLKSYRSTMRMPSTFDPSLIVYFFSFMKPIRDKSILMITAAADPSGSFFLNNSRLIPLNHPFIVDPKLVISTSRNISRDVARVSWIK